MKRLFLVLIVSGLLLMGCANRQTYVCANGAEVTDKDLCTLMSSTPSIEPVSTPEEPEEECGGLDARCCEGSVCTDPDSLCAYGICVSCGSEDEPCCADSQCSAFSTCVNGKCVACGGLDEPCCDQSDCTESDSTCINGKCVSCGGLDEPCCDQSDCTELDSTCINGKCVSCGGLDEPCCDDNSCGSLYSVCVKGRCIPYEKVTISESDLCSTISLILENADKCDSDAVSVTGTVFELVQSTSKAGNKYLTFRLIGGPNALNVFKRGSESLQEGQKVTVTGVFRKQKVTGNYTFYNQIDASEISP